MCQRETEFYAYLGQRSDKRDHAFEHNWPYILQATRNGFFTYRDRNSIVYYTRRFPDDVESARVIVHALGPERTECMLAVAREEYAHRRDVYIKNVHADEIGWWIGQGFRVRSNPWDEYAHFDDNTFPQYVNSHEVVRTAAYVYEYQAMIRRFHKTRRIVTSPYDVQFDGQAHIVLDEFARRMRSKGAASYEEAVRAHLFFFDPSVDNKVRLQHVEDGVLVGASYLTCVGSVAYMNALIIKSQDDLAKFLTHEAKYWITEHYPKVTHFIDQGSEKEGQDYMKRRYGTPTPIHKVHMEYVGV